MPLQYNIPKYSDGIKQDTQTTFKGFDARLSACDGAIRDMRNMSGDEYPIASTRPGRKTLLGLSSPNGLCCHDGVYYAASDGFYALNGGDSVKLGTLTDSRKRFASLGAYIVILPDKAYYNRLTGEFGSLEAEWNGTASFTDGTYAGIEAEACRIVTTGEAFPFSVGDAITISGADNDANNQTIIIREISEDKKSLGFYEHSFTNADAQNLTLKRSVPDMDFICENDNRLWGCKGDEIYASKPGDIFNWNVFDGLASDSYAVTVGSEGDFTACVSYLGYPIFFKEDKVYKVYGSKPSDFQVMSSASMGVASGSDRSLAIAGEVLYYHSRVGIMAYSGGVPQCVSSVFGSAVYTDAVGGSDGIRYYVSLLGSDGVRVLMCYDTKSNQWYKEDELGVVGFGFDGGRLLALSEGASGGALIALRGETADEGSFSSMCEFADFIEDSPNKKSTAKVQLRVELDSGSTLTVQISTDGGEYTTVRTLTAPDKRSYYLPILIRRCDHFRIRFKGVGGWRLYSLTREYSEGSQI